MIGSCLNGRTATRPTQLDLCQASRALPRVYPFFDDTMQPQTAAHGCLAAAILCHLGKLNLCPVGSPEGTKLPGKN
jgi:hypothetical protein